MASPCLTFHASFGCRTSAVRPNLDAGKVAERGAVPGGDGAIESPRGSCDHQGMRPARFALRTDRDEKLGMRLRDLEVVVENRDNGDDVLDVGTSGSDAQLRDPDGRDAVELCRLGFATRRQYRMSSLAFRFCTVYGWTSSPRRFAPAWT
jgi:hypothetical protein